MSFHERIPGFVQWQLMKLRKINKHKPGCADSDETGQSMEISCQNLGHASLFGARHGYIPPWLKSYISFKNENDTPTSLNLKSCSSAQKTLDEGYEDDKKRPPIHQSWQLFFRQPILILIKLQLPWN